MRSLLGCVTGMGLLLAVTTQPASANNVAHLRHQQRRRQHPRRSIPTTHKVVSDHQGDRGRPRRHVLARRHAGLHQQRGRPHARRVRPKTGKLIKKIPLSGRPNNIAVAKDGKRIVVAIAQRPGRARHHRSGQARADRSILTERPPAQHLRHARQQVRDHRARRAPISSPSSTCRRRRSPGRSSSARACAR